MNANPRPRAALPFGICYRAPCALADDVLAVVRFADAASATGDAGDITIGLAPLSGDEGDAPAAEIWTSPWPVTRGERKGIAYAHNGEVLFGQLLLREQDYPALDVAARDGYRRILAFLRRCGYPHALRMWNFFPGINEGDEDTERYKQFSAGRAGTYEQHADFERALPAASAIGSYRPGLLVYFIAARTPGAQIENRRQVSAFRYPRQYGPKSPSFSRAKLKDWGEGVHLYLSGTASVVGHESLHRHNLNEQVAEIGRNVRTLIDEAATRDTRLRHCSARDLDLLRVYLRPLLNTTGVHDAITREFGDVPRLYLAGDICRQELLVEVEGLLTHSG
ncbi:MAG: hypothetical protein L0H73_01280 [Nitrococcus sp.]|nr:hypothetical protein [Nitrococcus sp.]